tara:strand:+ start:7787 stop:8017 length:231 start_codon:yes stop_codon:yes gene_type:complete
MTLTQIKKAVLKGKKVYFWNTNEFYIKHDKKLNSFYIYSPITGYFSELTNLKNELLFEQRHFNTELKEKNKNFINN